MLTLAEELLLLALDDTKGTIFWDASSALGYGLGGALLMELALHGRIDVAGKHIAVVDSTPLGDPLLDTALATIAGAKKQRDAKHWITKLGGSGKVRAQLTGRLVERGILREEEHRVLFVFPNDRYPAADPAPERAIRERVRAVLLDNAEPDERTLLLISLLRASTLIDRLLGKTERKRGRARAKDLVEHERLGKAVGGAISDATASVMAATTAATTAVIVTSSS